MKLSALILLNAALTVGICSAALPAADFYVATNGSDKWSGTIADPNAAKTDGPFATLERARDAVRQVQVQGRNSADIVVLVRGGTYRLTQTVVLGLQDSGQGDSMIMQCAIRTDGGQTDTLIAENLIYKCTSQGIMLKLNNRCENNIVADIIAPPRGYCLALREGPMTGATIKRNIFYSSSEPCIFIHELAAGNRRTTEDRRGRGLAAATQADTDHNIYYCASNPDSGEDMLQKHQRDSVDSHGLSLDPLFVDPTNGDFRLQPDSPALKLGFIPFEMSKVGLVDKLPAGAKY